MSFSHFPPVPTGLSAGLAIHSNFAPNAFADLFTAVSGRLFPGVPLASPCFGVGAENENGLLHRSGTNQYLNETFRADIFGAFINTQWETCQATGAQCLLDSANTTNPKATSASEACEQGSIPSHFIDVRDAQDVAAAFTFSEKTGIPLSIAARLQGSKQCPKLVGAVGAFSSISSRKQTVIKTQSGWQMHNLKNMSYHPAFVPEGCSLAQPAATFGAGVQWAEAYEFADAHNITLVGGSDRTVGVVGGWLQGGGHGVLSNTMGLGVDRVLQFRVVTPDGKLRVANACQNEDLFFALRGGGGGTFGVVLEATLLASPPVTLQAVIVSWSSTSPNRTLTAELWKILTNNGLKWAGEGWGGFSMSEIAILVNPVLDSEQAAASMAPLVEFGARLKQDGVEGAETVVTTFPSFLAFFNAFTLEHVASVGTNLALSSRLIPKSLLSTPETQTQLVDALQATNDAGPGMIILLVPPVSYAAYQENSTSVTEAWRSSVYHVTAVASWAWNATSAEKRAAYQDAGKAIGNLRRITPDAAYSNEADVYEPNHEVSFWGSNYQELLRIKRKYDPRQLLDCWQYEWDREGMHFMPVQQPNNHFR
ncbi:Cytokinin dehydrogenase 11 [Mycena venus]|uniref:Cytokinin dehydrogenase 11 n=1 Tax=Mycena venus TaxID=2733690 RepID=A0A8H6XP74_9AGAR|nr:Cytokinin dehydrogenase 11 [Mycena venus]